MAAVYAARGIPVCETAHRNGGLHEGPANNRSNYWPESDDWRVQPANDRIPGSAGHETQPHGSDRIILIRVEQGDRLPRPKGHPATHNRHGQRWRRHGWHQVVRAVAGRPVAMDPPVVPR